MLKECSLRRENPRSLHKLEEGITVEDMARENSHIYEVLDNHQEDH